MLTSITNACQPPIHALSTTCVLVIWFNFNDIISFSLYRSYELHLLAMKQYDKRIHCG